MDKIHDHVNIVTMTTDVRCARLWHTPAKSRMRRWGQNINMLLFSIGGLVANIVSINKYRLSAAQVKALIFLIWINIYLT